jgi:hypothetical protein
MSQSRRGFKKPAPLPLPVAYDERYTRRAFDTYKQEHGFGDAVRLGDMPAQIISDILRRAQQLKSQEQSR